MASARTVIPHLFMSCCRRDRADWLMNEGVGLNQPVNSFAVSKRQLNFKLNTKAGLDQQGLILTLLK